MCVHIHTRVLTYMCASTLYTHVFAKSSPPVMELHVLAANYSRRKYVLIYITNYSKH